MSDIPSPQHKPQSTHLTGPRPVEECLQILHSLARQVEVLHESGSIHRQLTATTAASPISQSSGPVDFGGPFADPDLCPPELRRSVPLAVPASIEAARQVLIEAGVTSPPQRIDIFQLGTLLCRLVTGKSIRAYLSSPATMSRVPAAVRQIIDACTGYDEASRVDSVAALRGLVEASLKEHSSEGARLADASGCDESSPVDGHETEVEETAPAAHDTAVQASAETAVRRRPPFGQLGHFDIGEEIGHGGMGTVYRALDRTLDRTVAVKVLSSRFASDPDFVKRFQAEASAAAKLAHANIVPIYFIGEDSGRHFYAMQFVEGESLAQRLHRTPRLPREEALAIVYQMLQGLGAAHRQGLVHRDIKPGNIMIDRLNGQAMLTDFGLARIVSAPDKSDDEFVMGTAEYMSPEQARGDDVDIRSDLYSVGVLLYQLLSGATPFDAGTPSSQLLQHVFHPPKPLGEVSPDVEPELVAIVDRLLEKRPTARYQSVEELLIDLEAAQEDASARSDEEGPALRRSIAETGRPSSRRLMPKLAAVALLTVFFLIWRSLPESGDPAPALAVHADPVRSLTFSPDGTRLVSGGGRTSSLQTAGDTSLRLWDADTGRMLAVSDRLPSRPDRLVFLDDGRRVVALSSSREGVGTTIVWDTESGRLGREVFHKPFAFHFDAVQQAGATILAAGNDGLTRLAVTGLTPTVTSQNELPSGSPLRAVAHGQIEGLPVVCVAVQQGEQHFVAIVDAESHEEFSRLSSPGPVTAVVVSPDGATVVFRALVESERPDGQEPSGFDYVFVWNVASKKPSYRFGPFAPGSSALAMTPGGRRVLTIAEPSLGPRTNEPQSAVLLDVETGKEVSRFVSKSAHLTTLAVAPAGDLAALGDLEGRVTICRLPPE